MSIPKYDDSVRFFLVVGHFSDDCEEDAIAVCDHCARVRRLDEAEGVRKMTRREYLDTYVEGSHATHCEFTINSGCARSLILRTEESE